jgi:RNA polymerase sigma-70 factor (ECF subfamily)
MSVSLDEGLEVRKALGGDPAARDRILERIYPRVLRYLRKLAGGDLAAAEELAQESMLRLLRSLGGLRDPGRLVPWAFRIATNAWRDLRRSRPALPPPAAPGEAADPAEREELAARVLEALGGLPEIYRMALTLRYLEGLEYEAMAEALDVPVPTLRSHLARGRNLIRRQLESRP